MTLIPHRTVASQVALYLREELRKGSWRGWLPGERTLCAEIQTGRNTLRAALAQLRAEGLIEPVLGQGTRIIAAPKPAAAEAARVKTVAVAYHRDDVASVERALARVWDRGAPPTAILVSNSYAYLATASLLAQRGCRIPQDVSLISRDDDPFLEALAPEPARYRVSPHAFAKKLIGPILQLVARETPVRLSAPLLPKFTPGKSLARWGG